MKFFLSFLRSFFISLEFLFCLVAASIIVIYPDWPTKLRTFLDMKAEITKWMGLTPIALFVFSGLHFRKLLLPESEARSEFQDWEVYVAFKATVIVGITYSLVFGVSGLISWALSGPAYDRFGFALSITAVVGGLIVAFSLTMAEVTLNQILKKNAGATSKK